MSEYQIMNASKCAICLSLLLGSCTIPAASQDQTDFGTIEGQVLFTGEVPPPKKILTTDGGTLLHNDLVVDPKTKGLRHVVVILENVPAQAKVKKKDAVLVDQRDMVFLPRVVAIQSGQKVRFENNDLCNHSVMSASTVPANQFNIVAAPNQPYQHVFEPQKHPIQIGCSLHAWMRAWVYVVPHSWFAVSDAQGKFKIERIPPGKHTVWLRHADSGTQERQQIQVEAGKTAKLKVEWRKATEEQSTPAK
jgi:plastocyanin